MLIRGSAFKKKCKKLQREVNISSLKKPKKSVAEFLGVERRLKKPTLKKRKSLEAKGAI